jgi:tetratricopeptide (TPR) repeat protein
MVDQSAENFVALWNATTHLSDQHMCAVFCHNVLNEHLFPQNYGVRMRVLQRTTAPYPEDRFPSIDAFVQALVEAEPASKHVPASGKTFNSRANTISGPLLQDAPQPTGKGGGEGSVPPRQQIAQSMGTLPERVKSLGRPGGKLFTDHRYQEALQVYEQALALDSGNATLWMALSDTFLATEQYTEVLSAYEKNIALNPLDAETWTNCGTVLEALAVVERRRHAMSGHRNYGQRRHLRKGGNSYIDTVKFAFHQSLLFVAWIHYCTSSLAYLITALERRSGSDEPRRATDWQLSAN